MLTCGDAGFSTVFSTASFYSGIYLTCYYVFFSTVSTVYGYYIYVIRENTHLLVSEMRTRCLVSAIRLLAPMLPLDRRDRRDRSFRRSDLSSRRKPPEDRPSPVP